jgi:pyruvate carboxylase
MLAEKRALLTDTTMRDAHQSLFATRMRTADMTRIAPHYARMVPGLFSMECWGGATFDVALRFLKEDPWQRLARLREAVPNVLFQMLLRASNAVGYTNYSDNVVRYFVQQAARGIDGKGGIDLFRVFDSLNWVENMRVAIDAVRETGALCEGAICYTGDLHDSSRKYSLKYYVDIARDLQKAGVHILGIKDMAGVCRPRSVRELVRALKEETGLPIHFHTHDTSGIAAASVLAAVEAGADAVDGALDSMSGLTSQPNLGAIVAALEGTDRDPCVLADGSTSGVDRDSLQSLSDYWEGVRKYYAPFEAEMRSGTADVYRHEMPGRPVHEPPRAGPRHRPRASLVRGVAGLRRCLAHVRRHREGHADLEGRRRHGDLHGRERSLARRRARSGARGRIPGVRRVALQGRTGLPTGRLPREPLAQGAEVRFGRADPADPPRPYRPGDTLAAVDLDDARRDAEKVAGHHISDTDLASYLMYPKVFRDYAEHHRHYGDVSVLPTPAFFYGMANATRSPSTSTPARRS